MSEQITDQMSGGPGGRTVAVTGASGFVGRHCIRTLLHHGWRVRALVRDRGKAREVLPEGGEAQGLEVVVGDVFEAPARAALVRDCSAVVHAIGIRRELPPDIRFDKLHVQAAKVMIDECVARGVPRFALISALGVRANASTEYARTKWEAETLLRRSGLDWTILRPSIVHGVDGEFMAMVKGWVLGNSPPFVFIPYFTRLKDIAGFPPTPGFESARVAPVAVEDVAAAVATSLETRDAVGEVYCLSGPDELSWPEMLAAVRDRLPLAKANKPIIGIPGYIGWIGAMKAKLLGVASLVPFGTSEPILAMEDSVASREKASAHLGYTPRPFVDTMAGYVEHL
ncbi:MAG: NAD(P)H-binding protein [Planctomycetota bacterium]